MALFKILKGNKSGLDTKSITNGYCYVTLDEQKMYIDHVNESTGIGSRFCLNADHADTADSASKLDCGNVGNRTTPVYFANGVPQTCEQLKTETLTVRVNGENAGSFDGSQPVTVNIDTISETDVNNLLKGYLPLSAGEQHKINGPLGLTVKKNYGTLSDLDELSGLSEHGFEGEIFFVQDPNNYLYLPTGGSIGQVLVKNSSADGDTRWTTLRQDYLPLSGGTLTGPLTTLGPLNGTYYVTTNYGTDDPNTAGATTINGQPIQGIGVNGALYFKIIS